MEHLKSIKTVLFSMLLALSVFIIVPSCGGSAQQESEAEQTEAPAAEEAAPAEEEAPAEEPAAEEAPAADSGN